MPASGSPRSGATVSKPPAAICSSATASIPPTSRPHSTRCALPRTPRHEPALRHAGPGVGAVRALVPDPVGAVLGLPATAAQREAAAVRHRRAAALAARLRGHPALGPRLRRPAPRRHVAPDPRHLRRLRRLPAGPHHRRLHPPRRLPKPLTSLLPARGEKVPRRGG